MKQYTIVLTPDPEDGGYTVRVPTLPGCNSQGDTMEDAISNAREAISVYLADLVAMGEPIPEEKEPIQTVTVQVEAPAA